MRIAVVGGSGRIGRAVALDLALDPEVERVAISGIDAELLEEARAWLAARGGGERIAVVEVDATQREPMLERLGDYDVWVATLPGRRASYRVLENAIAAGCHLVDILEEYHRRPDLEETEGLDLPAERLWEYGEELHCRARERGVTVLDGFGLAPGLTNVTVEHGIRRLDEAREVVVRVGGVPSRAAAERHPLRYMITWSFEHVLREYSVESLVLEDGKVTPAPAGSGLERFRFRRFGRDEVLECAITPGMPSFVHTRSSLQRFAEKTVRWPGHWEGVQTLKECGLLDLEPVDYAGTPVIPRKLLSALVTPRLRPAPGDTDVSVMYNSVRGTLAGHETLIESFMWDEADPQTGLTSMQRATAFPAALGARFLARGQIEAQGIVAPEDAVSGSLYEELLRELAARGIRIEEETTRV